MRNLQAFFIVRYQISFITNIFLFSRKFRSYERDAFSSLRLTRNSDLKRKNGFCSKPPGKSKASNPKFLSFHYG